MIGWAQQWEESEKGWGTRPDGYSLHANMRDVPEYVNEYWSSMPAAIPSTYSRPVGRAFPCPIDEKYDTQIYESAHGIRVYDWNPATREDLMEKLRNNT